MTTNRLKLAALLVGAFGFATIASAQAAAKAPSKKLVEGLEKLHADNQAEIQAGQLAQQNGMSPEVKSFGEQMVTDHTKVDQQLASIAQNMGVNLEGTQFQKQQKDAQKTYQKLQGKSGAAFDKQYASQMVKDHQSDTKAVKKLAQEAQKENQPELATFLNQTEQGMQGHLSHAKQLEAAEKSASKRSQSTTGSGSSQGGGTGGGSNQGGSGMGGGTESDGG